MRVGAVEAVVAGNGELCFHLQRREQGYQLARPSGQPAATQRGRAVSVHLAAETAQEQHSI